MQQQGSYQGQGNQTGQNQVQSKDNKAKKGQTKGAGTTVASGSGYQGSQAADFTDYPQVTSYNYGDPGHHRAMCDRPKKCFICKSVSHQVDTCPVKKRPHQVAKYIGSDALGLGFYHLEATEMGVNSIGVMKNYGVVFVETGEISKEELAQEFSIIYKTNWPWQIRSLDEWSFVVKFPPHISVEQVAGYPCFGLTKSDVTVNVEVWKEELGGMDDLVEVWIQIRGLLPKGCEWSVLDQCTSSFGLLLDMD